MPLARFYQLVRVSQEQHQAEERSKLELIAWQTWQTNIPHWTKPVKFEKWKEIVGLTQTVETAEDQKMTPQEALDHAMKIMQSDKKRRIEA